MTKVAIKHNHDTRGDAPPVDPDKPPVGPDLPPDAVDVVTKLTLGLCMIQKAHGWTLEQMGIDQAAFDALEKKAATKKK